VPMSPHSQIGGRKKEKKRKTESVGQFSLFKPRLITQGTRGPKEKEGKRVVTIGKVLQFSRGEIHLSQKKKKKGRTFADRQELGRFEACQGSGGIKKGEGGRSNKVEHCFPRGGGRKSGENIRKKDRLASPRPFAMREREK